MNLAKLNCKLLNSELLYFEIEKILIKETYEATLLPDYLVQVSWLMQVYKYLRMINLSTY